jgi:transcriptional regulator with XRE-family HTH domain
MEDTVKERLLEFIKYKGLTKNKFEIMCGLSKRYVSNISRSISPDVLKKISLTFPDLNTSWLMAGSGDMLNVRPSRPESPSITLSKEAIKLNLNLSETIRSQQETIQQLTDMLKQALGMQSAPKKDIAG